MNWSWRPPGMPASTASSRQASSATSRASRLSPRAADSAATRATSSAPELPRPEPGGASDRVVSVQAPTGSRRRPACSSASRPSRASAAGSGTSRLASRSSETSRKPRRRPARTSAWANSPIAAGDDHAAFTGGERRDVGPAAGEVQPHRRRGVRGHAPRSMAPPTSRAPSAARPADPWSPRAPVDSSPEDRARDTEGHRHRVGEQALGGGRIRRRRRDPPASASGPRYAETQDHPGCRARRRRNRARARTRAPERRDSSS